MIDAIIKTVENDSFIEFITVAFFLYATILWILVPIWVFIDSKKKYNNSLISTALFFLILPLNIPGLLFYIIIRPDEEKSNSLGEGHLATNNSVINVPFLNFLDNDNNVVMSLDFSINNGVIRDEMKKDIHLSMNIDSNKDLDISLLDKPTIKIEGSVQPEVNNPQGSLFGTFLNKFKIIKENTKSKSSNIDLQSQIDNEVKKIDTTTSEETSSSSISDSNKIKKKKKKKNRNR